MSSSANSAFRADGGKRMDRAAQFAPFAALTGYYDYVRKQERQIAPRRELSEEDALRLSQTLSQLAKGSMARVTYYDADAYVTRTGVVSEVVLPYRYLMLVRTRIDFDDIWDIEELGSM